MRNKSRKIFSWLQTPLTKLIGCQMLQFNVVFINIVFNMGTQHTSLRIGKPFEILKLHVILNEVVKKLVVIEKMREVAIDQHPVKSLQNAIDFIVEFFYNVHVKTLLAFLYWWERLWSVVTDFYL